MARPCLQLLFKKEESSPFLPKSLLIKHIEFVGVESIENGESRLVNYPNNAPQSQVFQKNRLILKLKFSIRAAYLDANNDLESEELLDEFIKNILKDVSADIAIDLKVQNGKDVFVFEVLETSLDTLLSFASGGKQTISNLFAAGQETFGLIKQIADMKSQISSSMQRPLSSSITIRHIDIGYNKTLDIVEVRIEVKDDGVPSFDAISFWSQFYANQFDNILGGSQWSIFFDQRIGASIIARELPIVADNSGIFRRDGDVNINWDGGFPGYRVSISGEAIDACRCLWGKIDVDVRVPIDMKFSIANGRLRSDIWFDPKVTDMAEPICCLLTGVTFFPIVGLEYALDDKSLMRISWYEYLVGLYLYPYPLILLLAGLFKMVFADSPSIQYCQPDQADDKHVICDIFQLPGLYESIPCSDASVTMRIVTMNGRSDGLVLGGVIDMPAIIHPQVEIEADDLKYRVSYGCSHSPDDGERFSTMIRISRTSGNYDFRLCNVIVLGPLDGKVQTTIESKNCPYAAWIKLWIPFWDYDGKPLKVILVTTQGAYHITIPAAEIISETDRKKAVMNAQFERISKCYAKSKRWDRSWMIDPAPYTGLIRTKQLWALTGVASKQTNKVNVLNADGGRLATINVAQNKTFRLSLINPSNTLMIVQETESDIKAQSKVDYRTSFRKHNLFLGNDLDPGENKEDLTEKGICKRDLLTDSEVHMVQTLLGVEREITFEGIILAVDTLRIETQRRVIIHQEHRLSLFNVSQFGSLILLSELDAHDLLWVGRRGITLYAQNTDGRMFALDLRQRVFSRWQEITGSKTRLGVAKSSYRCINAKANEGRSLQQESYFGVNHQIEGFDHFLLRGCAIPSERPCEGRIHGAFQIAQVGSALLVAAVDRKLANVAAATLDDPMAATPVRVDSDMFLALSDDGYTLQLLRVLARHEV